MVYAGAQGDTESQMADVFQFLSQENQHVTLNAIDQQLQAFSTLQTGEEEAEAEAEAEGTPFQLRVANAVWSQKGFVFNQPYLDLLATQYGAGLRVLDFENSVEGAREAINAWVDEKTDGHIKEIAGPGSISNDTRLVLTNAILFKAGWAYKFDQDATANGLFTLINGSQMNTPLMHLRAPLDFVENEEYQAVRLPYVKQDTEMWIILPADGYFKVVQEMLNPELLNAIRQQAGMDEVSLTLPSFDFELELPLNDLLIQMGLTKSFCPAGNFDGISEGAGLCIDQAVHKATITVDEEGTEATAATLIAFPVSIMKEVTMTVDRPFIFVIMTRDSGLILFLGQVLNPVGG